MTPDLTGRGVRQRNPVKKSKPRSRKTDPEVIAAAKRFREGVFELARAESGDGVVECFRKGQGPCHGPMDPHHIVKRRLIALNHSTFRMPKSAKLELEYAPENGIPLCRRHHDLVTDGHDWLWRHEVPERTERWARDNDRHAIVYLLGRECPSLNGNDEPPFSDERPPTTGRGTG